MINPYNFVKAIKNNKINFITGVPDSLLKNLTNCISDKLKKNHIISIFIYTISSNYIKQKYDIYYFTFIF